MKFDLLKEHYFFELNRKQALESGLALPVAVFTGLGGVIFTLCTTFEFGVDWLTLIFAIALSAILFFLIKAFSFITQASLKYTYELAPSADDLYKYKDSLKAYYASKNQPDRDIEPEFEEQLKKSYAQAATVNKNNNDSRAGYLFKANKSLIIVVLSLVLSAIPYAIKIKLKVPEPQKIQIVNDSGGKNDDGR